jgi:hypothetical protein
MLQLLEEALRDILPSKADELALADAEVFSTLCDDVLKSGGQGAHERVLKDRLKSLFNLRGQGMSYLIEKRVLAQVIFEYTMSQLIVITIWRDRTFLVITSQCFLGNRFKTKSGCNCEYSSQNFSSQLSPQPDKGWMLLILPSASASARSTTGRRCTSRTGPDSFEEIRRTKLKGGTGFKIAIKF